MKTIDSAKQKLNIADIVAADLENTDSEYPPKVAFPAIIAEMSQKNTKHVQLGNTIFILHKGDNGMGFFRVLNADTPKNFLESSKKFLAWAKQQGMGIIMTQSPDKFVEQAFKEIAKKFPIPGMGYQSFYLKNGDTRIVLNLGVGK